VNQSVDAGALRRQFFSHLLRGLRIVWPILFGLLALMAVLGSVVAVLEHWPLIEGIYFAFVTGLTIGYGDLAPKGTLGRVLAIGIGFVGVLLVALVAAVSVQALDITQNAQR